jgi:two-component system nitrate/nitrite response regulator NarL
MPGGRALLRILFADDHAMVRDGMRPFLEMLDSKVDLREAETFDAALTLFAPEESPHLAVLDLHMPGMNQFEGIARLRAAHPNTKIAVVSGYYDKKIIDGVIAAGARGFVPKTSTGKTMVGALRIILEGEAYVPHGLLAEGATNPLPRSPQPSPSGTEVSPLGALTARELEILRHVIDGQTNKQIGRKISLSEITIKGHLRVAYKKIGAANRADAVRIALHYGLE